MKHTKAESLLQVLLFVICFLIIPLKFAVPAYADNENLVGHWKFDETVAGSTAVDSAGTNNGTPTGDPTPSSTVPPVSFEDPRSVGFNGSNYFTITRPISTNFSICAWIKTSSTGGGSNHWESAPIFDSESGGVDYDFGFGIGNGGKLMFGNGGLVSGNLVDRQVNGDTTINDDEWHNVCVTRNNSNGEVKLYVDAQLDGSGTTGTGALTKNPNARFGYGYDGAALYNGLIDDLRVYDIVLDETQLQNITDGSDDPDSPSGGDEEGITSPVATLSISGESTPGPAACNSSKPAGIPNLFRVDTAGTYANLYFTTTGGSSDYNINYGLTPAASQYGDLFNYSGTAWIIGRTISSLYPNTTYYFKVQPLNGCNAGDWSKTVEVKTKSQFANISDWFANLNPFKSAPPALIVTAKSNPSNVAGISKTNASLTTPDNCNYTFTKGESLFGIARNQLGTWKKLDQILNLNPGLDPRRIKDGQQIKLCE